MKFKMTQSGEWKHTFKLLNRCKSLDVMRLLDRYGQRGVNYLSEATPKDTGETAMSWKYVIERTLRGYELKFLNTNFNDGCPIAIILQYGHATRGGTWVEGIDYINPAIREAFKGFAADLWKEVLL